MHKIKQQHQQQEEDLKHNDSIVSLSSLKYRDYSIRSRSWIDAAHELKTTNVQIFWEGHKKFEGILPWLSFDVKVWVFWEGHKIWKNPHRIFDKSVVFCARNSVLVKKSTKIFQNKCGQVVLYKLYILKNFRKRREIFSNLVACSRYQKKKTHF